MSLDILGNLGEFLGAIGVIVSLIYLARQIRQNPRAVKTASHHAITDSFNSFLTLLVKDRRASDILSRGIGDLAALSEDERDTFYSLLGILFGQFANAFFHYSHGMVDETQWVRWRIATGWYVGFPGVAIWWANRRAVYDQDFRDFVERERELQGPTDPGQWAPAIVLPQSSD